MEGVHRSAVGKRGLEPLRLAALDPKSSLSANSSTSPIKGCRVRDYILYKIRRQSFMPGFAPWMNAIMGEHHILFCTSILHTRTYRSTGLGRVINTESAGRERNQLVKAIVVALRELAAQSKPDLNTRDLLAFITISLEAISDTIEPSVGAWEKRGYWVKADRFRMEWQWTKNAAEKLRHALLADDWGKVASLMAEIGGKLTRVQVSPRHRLGTPWKGAWERLDPR